MRRWLFLLALLSSFAAPSQAASMFVDSFDGENGGSTSLNYTGFANFSVTGSVDLVRSGDHGITCSMMCVDLDGSTGNGGVLKSSTFAFAAGATVTISFDIGGSQRSEDYDQWYGFIVFETPVDLSNLGLNYYGSPQNHGPFLDLGSIGASGFTYGAEPFLTRSLFFSAIQGGSFWFEIGTLSTDNIGPLLDQVAVDIAAAPAIPEPQIWTMMITGFGLSGAALRRRHSPGRIAAI